VTDGPGAGFPEVLGQYQIVRRLGAGGMGTVFEGIDRRVDMRVAIKLLHPHLAADASYRERFEREAHVAALLRSPYTVHLLDYGFAQGFYYLVMQFVDGHTVADELAKGAMQPARALSIAADVARATEEAEARGVVHRDIKPENILLGTDGSVKVADFGIARQTYSTGVTVPGGFVGTSAFAAPEQVDGTVDTRTDIYAIGGTLFTMLTGHPPFAGGPLELLRQHRDAAPPLEQLAHLPPMLGQIVGKCLAKRPAQRYQHPSELVGALERALHDVETATVPTQTVTMIVPPGGAGTPATPPVPQPPVSPDPNATARLAGTVVTRPPGGTTSGALRMDLKPQTSSTGSRVGATLYTLVLQSHVEQPTEVALRFDDPSGEVGVEMPTAVVVPPMGSSVVSVRVRPKRRRWLGSRLARTFMVTADGSSGGVPPVSATGQLDDLPRGPVLIGGGVLGALALAAFAGLGAANAFSGGGGDAPPATETEQSVGGRRTPTTVADSTPRDQATSTPAISRTTIWGPEGTPTAGPTETPTPQPTAVPTRLTLPTATSTSPPSATATPTSPVIPVLRANTGTWTLTMEVTFNNCPFGQVVGGAVEEAYEFYEANGGNDYMEPGEPIDAYQTRTGAYLGQYTFSYPQWTIGYEILATDGSPGIAYLGNTFTAEDRTIPALEEYYTTASGSCQIFYE